MLKTALAVSAALLVAGCNTTKGPGSVAGGPCSFLHTPKYTVKGATKYDQQWADEVTESLVAGCNQKRPQARPASLDAKPIIVKPVAPKKKPSIWDRFR